MERAKNTLHFSLDVTNLSEIQELRGTFLSRLTQFSNNIIQIKQNIPGTVKEVLGMKRKIRKISFF